MIAQPTQLLALKETIQKHPSLQRILEEIQTLEKKYLDFATQEFLTSQDYRQLTDKVAALRMEEVEQIMDDIKCPDTIVALPLSLGKNHSVYFILLPPSKMFNWHSHPRMVGLSKCVYGHL